MDLLRISTAGSVDDGKSTLIGRLLYDSNALTTEQETFVIQKTKEKGLSDLDFSVITDGLVAEREQGITIDVAHIYFSSNRRKFIISDSPGHIEYTRNMVTGASNSEISIILVDARKGLLEQSYRHFFISQLLKLHTVIFCVNKMDLVDYQKNKFDEICTQIQQMLRLYDRDVSNVKIIPISSLKGDNVVHLSSTMDWYKGNTLNDLLHSILPKASYSKTFRMDIQNVLHVQNDMFTDYRGYTGRVLSGILATGETIKALPSGRSAKITEIRHHKDIIQKADAGESISISIDADIDISRGSLIIREDDTIDENRNLKATLVWLDESSGHLNDKFIIKSGTRTSQAKLQQIHHIIPPEHPKDKIKSDTLKLNDIGFVEILLSNALYLDSYKYNKKNGNFILIHPNTNNTCAVGFID